MPSTRTSLVAIVAAYNVIQNRVLPQSLYVPANIVVSAALVGLARRGGCSWADLGMDPAQATDGFRVGAVVAGVTATAGVLSLAVPATRSRLLDDRAADQDGGDILYHTLVRFPLGTALFEEVVFRGVVEAVLRREEGGRVAAVAAAVLFGLWHLVPTKDALSGNPATAEMTSKGSRAGVVTAGAVVTGIASLGFSWLRNRAGSVVAPWLAHSAMSCAGYLASVAAWRREVCGYTSD